MKRSTLISLMALGVILIILGGWYFFFHHSSVPLTPGPSGSPFGEGGSNVSPSTTTPSTAGLGSDGKPLPRLFKISDAPVAGATAIIKGGFEMIRYVDRATGHIYDVNPVTLEKTKITNNTLPKIYEAQFRSDGNAVLMRSLDNNIISNISLALTPPKASSTDGLYTVIATPIRGFIGEVSGGTNLSYILADSGKIITSKFDGTGPKEVFSSAFTNWRIWSNNQGTIALTTKAASTALGYAYRVSNSGTLVKILGPLKALTALPSPDLKLVAYSDIENGATVLSVTDIANEITTTIYPTTFPEKCAWSTKNKSTLYCGSPALGIGKSEPDLWYQGVTHFSDSLWMFNTASGFSDVLAEPKKDFNVDIDVVNPMLSPDEDYFIFMNKNDLSLWALKLE